MADKSREIIVINEKIKIKGLIWYLILWDVTFRNVNINSGTKSKFSNEIPTNGSSKFIIVPIAIVNVIFFKFIIFLLT